MALWLDPDQGWRERPVACACGWRGRALECAAEPRRYATDLECPECAETLASLRHPRREPESSGPPRFPELAGDTLDFVWELHPEGPWFSISVQGREIWKEKAVYEGWRRYEEIKAALGAAYGKRLRSVTATEKAKEWLLGDDLSAPDL